MTTAQLGLVTTAAVGIAAVLSPAVSGWLERRHGRGMTRSTRLYEQRRDTYVAVGRFLERGRLILERLARPIGAPSAPPFEPTDEEWIELQGSVAVCGSETVLLALAKYRYFASAFGSAAVTYLMLERQKVREIGDAQLELERTRTRALETLAAAQAAMRDELTKL